MKVHHFPVTETYWRGCYGSPIGKLRRACDWEHVRKFDVSTGIVNCADCIAYRDRLKVLMRGRGVKPCAAA